MSNPVSNVEIEDVLSSIRKLVADERRVAPAKKPVPEKLVLTPALRVREPDGAASPPPQTTEPRPAPVVLTDPQRVDVPGDEDRDRSIDDIPRDARLAEFGDVETAFPDLDSFDSEPSGTDEEAARLPLDRMIEEEVAAALGVARETLRSGAADPVADEEDAESWPDEAAGDWTDPEPDALDLIEDPDAPPQDIPAHWPEDDNAESVQDVQKDPVKAPLLTLEDKVAALSRLVARGSNDFEEERDRAGDDEIAAVVDPMTWPDPAPFDEMVEPEPETGSNVLRSEGVWPAARPQVEDESEPAPAEVADVFEDEESRIPGQLQIDEDQLRELVVDIVRAELQGALGERITRNVRKLVRREIHRMLISQEME